MFTQQSLPVDGYNSKDYDLFTVAGRTCIEEGNSAQVLSIVLDEKNQVKCRVLGHIVRVALDKVFLFLSVGHCKMYGLESAATTVPGSSEERGQKPLSVPGHLQPLATGITAGSVINI